MKNAQMAMLFDELADIMEIAGEDFYKIKAYRNVNVSLRMLEPELNRIPSEKLGEIPGVGRAIAEKIEAALQTGTFPTLEKWRQSGFASLRPLLAMPGMTMRKLRKIIKTFDIKSLDDLKRVISDKNISDQSVLDDTIKQQLATYIGRLK